MIRKASLGATWTQPDNIRKRLTKGFHTSIKKSVSIMTINCHNVVVIVEGLTASNKKEQLYLYPSDIGCQ